MRNTGTPTWAGQVIIPGVAMMTAGLGVVLGVAACMGSSQGFRGGKFGSWFADNKVKD